MPPPRFVSRARSCLCLLGLLATAAASPGAARTFEVATGKSYPPFVGTELPEKGLATAVLRAALNQQGHKLSLTFMSWKRAFLATRKGATDGTYPYVPTAKRRQHALYSQPMFRFRAEVISAPERPVPFTGDPASLTDRTICLPKGYAVESKVMDLVEADRIDKVAPYGVGKCPALLKAGRADFAVFNSFVWPPQFAAAGHEPENFSVADTPVKENTLHYIVGKQHPKARRLLEAVNAGLSAIRANGTYESIVARHMEPSG